MKLTLVNSNRMKPGIAPVALDYIASAAKKSRIDTEILDLCFEGDWVEAVRNYFSKVEADLVGITFRNSDDCFWPSGKSFVPLLKDMIDTVRTACDAPIVLGGAGYSVFPVEILKYTNADFGIHGDGEKSVIHLMEELAGSKRFDKVDGLLWSNNEQIIHNRPAWPERLTLGTERNAIDNKRYFLQGGQIGLETKRGCDRPCVYCADPCTKGNFSRLREPTEVADEAQSLLDMGIDVLHTCDAEFNIPISHARAVCEQFVRRKLGDKIQWYTYLSVVPFDEELASLMRKAGCVGINFTGDSANTAMLKTYRKAHGPDDIAKAVRLCRDNGLKVMIDLLLGGPGETPESVTETIDFMKKNGPDCIGAALGIRIYPGTEMARIVKSEGLKNNPNIRRHYEGEVNFFKPTFYISSALGDNPAGLVRGLIAGDKRFFEPMEEQQNTATSKDHNYNDNDTLVEAIANGARGAYWDVLSGLRGL